MVSTINMQDMRHLNLFSKVTRINTRFCFSYNEAIVFCVPRRMLAKAIGMGARNIRELSYILKKRIKIIPEPKGIEDVKSFIENIVKPVKFKDLAVEGNEIVIDSGGMQNKAMLLGRNKQRLLEMQGIIKDFFGKEFRVA